MKVRAVRIPAGITDSGKLLHILADGLKFPYYFGHNWNALYDLLCDFSWSDEEMRIVIRHHDLPALPSSDQQLYLKVLRDAVGSWSATNAAHRLEVIFPDYVDW